ncbi:hypothetical protein [Candidatus Villigracilis affinis]|uniref:hypothetical protein n=1 Tax=Candidatus Villigracilis affinis TaxID=3140682 RepID=UPI002A232133|nr:hypothetical protein [Anaerolineales bacterium]
METLTGAVERINELEMQEAKLLENSPNMAVRFLKNANLRRSQWARESKPNSPISEWKRPASVWTSQTKPDVNGIPCVDGTRIAFDQNGFDRVNLIAPNPG